MPALFGNHMVLQEGITLPVWGWADPNEKITVSFARQTVRTVAGSDGKWLTSLTALPEGSPPGTLSVAGKNSFTFSDVVVGDVWVCAGQSNMEYGLRNPVGRNDAAAADPQIRLFLVPHREALQPADDVKGSWEVCSPHPASGISGVAYFFAKGLRRSVNQPIGLIESAYSGSSGQAWIDLTTLQTDPATELYVDEYTKIAGAYPGGQSQMDAEAISYAAADKAYWDNAYKDPAFQETLKNWNAASALARQAGQVPPLRPKPPFTPPTVPAVSCRTPAMLFNGMIAPLATYGIKGVLWYQGEENARIPAAFEYRNLLSMLVSTWRKHWSQGDFPFVIVQLPNYSDPPKTAGEASIWAVLRESQLHILSLPNTGVVVTVDLGDGNLHPPDKFDVGERAALVARRTAYGQKIVCNGPIFRSMKVEGNSIRISFQPDSLGSGLAIGSSPRPGANPLADKLDGFAIAGADKCWAWADAEIDGNDVVISSPQVALPVAVRYAWAQNPTCNLYNKEGLPASPFRTDDWSPFK